MPSRKHQQPIAPMLTADLRTHCAIAASIAVVVTTLTIATPVRAATLTVPVRVRIATCMTGLPAKPGDVTAPTPDHMPQAVRSPLWVKRHIKAAQRLFSQHNIRLMVEVDSFTPSQCDLLTRSDRHALAKHVDTSPNTATVLIVRRIRDLDVPSYNLMGVHWRYRGPNTTWKGRRWVYLTARAKPPVLAHELCHFFGLPHDPAGGNLMTPGPSAPHWRRPGKKPLPFAPILTATQVKQLRIDIARFLRKAAPQT